MADDFRPLRSITPRNILSFGPDTEPIELRPLNVLIGPNGSGKSNLLDVIGLIRSSPRDLTSVTRRGGGASEWVWKGRPSSPCSIDLTLGPPFSLFEYQHHLGMALSDFRLSIHEERIVDTLPRAGKPEPDLFYEFRTAERAKLLVNDTSAPLPRRLPVERDERELFPGRSILSQLRDPIAYPELSHLAEFYDRIRIYRDWSFGRDSPLRSPQPTDLSPDVLQEDFLNLSLILSRRLKNSKAKRAIVEGLRELYHGITDFGIEVQLNAVWVYLTEGEFTISAPRLSDGTLRYLALLAILCDPDPPPLVCIEEPEIGLHPDIIPKIADMLVEASTRMQLIVTTHSDILLDALTDRPESILVCEKREGQTRIGRLTPAELRGLLDESRLGGLWIKGHLGGVRW